MVVVAAPKAGVEEAPNPNAGAELTGVVDWAGAPKPNAAAGAGLGVGVVAVPNPGVVDGWPKAGVEGAAAAGAAPKAPNAGAVLTGAAAGAPKAGALPAKR